MATEDRLKIEITKSGYQAAIDNSSDAKGFKIRISEAAVYDKDNKMRGRFDVVGKNVGQQQISLRTVVRDKVNSYGIKTIKLIDEYSGVDFAIITHPKDEMIDYVNPHKSAYIICNLILSSLEGGTVTIVDSSSVDADHSMLEGQIADINEKLTMLPGVNLPGNQDTSGNADTATKLKKPCKIDDVYFDGSQDIRIVPAGAVFYFARQTPPEGYLVADGSAISRDQYKDLFAAIGTTFGAGNGKTTFNLPDLRGEFIRGWDAGHGVDKNRAFGSWQIGTPITHDDNVAPETFDVVAMDYSAINYGDEWIGKLPVAFYSAPFTYQNVAWSKEFFTMTRPRNMALLCCIKY